MREAVRRADGVLFEAGGAWTFGDLENKLVVLTGKTANVFYGKAVR
jgi:hypothetical protein